ncbi:uncharacterized protein EI90DRAFT_1827534 [Cantharellus anzutake]|uniref:uncharacterized protein n=1 Tax=Cantharellus anzutake TaxID=1750568 RepID=UPI0019041BE0|nr:uncharacterized protein EI90DRAFT_1827534 [Cantharellus anzutake]KAF8327175.1 hypothetical protein EI90DRAFT_1827534 [Cantharellus anzutake]
MYLQSPSFCSNFGMFVDILSVYILAYQILEILPQSQVIHHTKNCILPYCFIVQ